MNECTPEATGSWYVHACGERAWIASPEEASGEGCDACESSGGAWSKEPTDG